MNDLITRQCEELEARLGDPHDPASATGFAQSLEADEREVFPEAGFAALCELDYLANLVPEAEGGRLGSFDMLLALGRSVARRDLSLAIATGQCLLGALPVWIAGSAAQRRRLAELLRTGHSGGLALTEEEHGSDLAASEVRAERRGERYLLRGTKWCINNATRGAYLGVLARTAEQGGSRGFSILLVDKAELAGKGLAPYRKLRTHGIRGADISGMSFLDAELPATALVGKEGHGLDLTFKTMQVSRTLCCAFSLGAADTALRMALEFAEGRSLYGSTAYALPSVCEGLRRAFVALLVADLLADVSTRALSLMPEQMSVYSAAAKVLVPALCDEVIETAAVVLGARHYLREGRHAAFQKLRRDAAVVPLFDGSSAVNRSILAGQLARLSAARSEERALRGVEQGERARAAARLAEPAGAFAWDALKTSNRGRDDLLGGLEDSLSKLDAALPPQLVALARAVLTARVELDARLLERGSESGALPADVERWLSLLAAACLVHYLAGSAPAAEERAGLLAVCSLGMQTLLGTGVEVAAADRAADEAEVDRLLRAYAGGARMFSFRSIRLAESRSAP
jgi:alkylation response protein AidB-like acyl-CoA dehydrogenase